MTVETELKLRIAPEQLVKLKRSPLLKAHQLTRPVTRRLYNTYFDTPKLELNQSCMALRLRRSGKQWLQTLKGGGGVQGGLHRRNEWEVPVSGPALDFSLPQVAEWKELLPKKLRKQLQPVFVTDFSRNSRLIDWQGAHIELCMDQGEVSTEHARAPLCELELELKSGAPAQLFGFALAILDIVPFELEAVSKAEQGYRLSGGYTEQAVKASAMKLGKHENLSASLQTLIWAVLQQLQRNVRGASGSDSVEYIHQMRVAIRRMRVLLRMAESVCADEQLTGFKQEFAALGILLGKIREWDVFFAQTVQPMSVRMQDDKSLRALQIVCEQLRAAAYGALCNDTQSRVLQRLMLRFSIWMNGAYWQTHELDGLNVRNFAESYLSRLARRFEQTGEHLASFQAICIW